MAVCFTPGNDCDDMLIAAINGAQKTVRMAAYSFTSAPIADALIAARQRGVKVWVVLDSGQWTARGSQGHRLRQAGVGVRYDAKHAIMHNKFVVIDIQQTATGSYNVTLPTPFTRLVINEISKQTELEDHDAKKSKVFP